MDHFLFPGLFEQVAFVGIVREVAKTFSPDDRLGPAAGCEIVELIEIEWLPTEIDIGVDSVFKSLSFGFFFSERIVVIIFLKNKLFRFRLGVRVFQEIQARIITGNNAESVSHPED